ncbi:MAG: deoxyribose-phosphate aldolase [Parachlamydiales bacterium]|jgi:deoxyribose-phosphate aldolase
MKAADLARFIDHTLLKPNATKAEVEQLCQEAVQYGFKGVCVNPSMIGYAAELLAGQGDVLPIAVVGFPLGASQSSTKAFEAKEAVLAGAKEIDMVINIGALKVKDYEAVFQDLLAVIDEVRPVPVKVILETCYLTRDEKVIAAALAKVAGAAFVKTSTGFAEKGASEEDVALLKAVAGEGLEVKAAGGIRTYEDAVKMLKAGATRLGSSQSVSIVTRKEK